MALQLLDLAASQAPRLLELKLRELLRFGASDNVRVILPSNPIGFYHRDSLAFAILATAASKFSMEVRISANRWTDDALATVRHTPVGLLSLLRATAITNNANEPFPESSQDRIRSIAIAQKGILESESLRGRSYSYVGIDAVDDRSRGFPIPRILDGDLTKEAFTRGVANVVLRSFGLDSPNQLNVTDKRITNLVQCLYEVFRNTHDHARRTVKDEPIGGVRYLQIRKRIANSPAQLVPAAEGFEELTKFLEAFSKDSRASTTAVIEINIADRRPPQSSHAQGKLQVPQDKSDISYRLTPTASAFLMSKPGSLPSTSLFCGRFWLPAPPRFSCRHCQQVCCKGNPGLQS